MTTAILVQGITVAYRDQPVLWNVDLAIPTQTMTAIIGPNGAGKTTLLKSMIGLVTPISGKVTFPLLIQPSKRPRLAYVPQRGTVDWDFPTTVFDVVLMGTYGQLGMLRRPGQAERERTHQAIADVGLEAFERRQIGELSGGQQQRTFLARALVQQAPIMLLDEPFQGVDATTETAIVNLLRRERDAGRTIIAVHHDLSTTHEYFDRVVMLNVNKIADGPTADVFTPANIALAYKGKTPARL